jgi:hypothetical protein
MEVNKEDNVLQLLLCETLAYAQMLFVPRRSQESERRGMEMRKEEEEEEKGDNIPFLLCESLECRWIQFLELLCRGGKQTRFVDQHQSEEVEFWKKK